MIDPMTEPLIACTGLNKCYGSGATKTYALCNVDCTIAQGEFVAIMGPSGSGKSTFMHILGLLDRPTSGHYFFDGRDTAHFDDMTLATLRNQSIGFVFQAFNLLPRMRVTENVTLPLLYDRRGESRSKQGERVRLALEAVGLSQRAQHYTNQLSGGEQQRAAIARALVNNPSVIFADEPTGNLDSKSGLQVLRILQHLNNQGKTVVLVTHETATAQHAKRILSMRDGAIVNDASVRNRKIADHGEVQLK